MRNTKSNKGFTLIELLIVIAIIGILAAVLIPNLLSARTRALDTTAQSCARSISTGMEIAQIDAGPGGQYPVIEAFDDLEGTNSCEGLTLVGEPTGGESYSVTVEHPNGNSGFTVTPDGIETIAHSSDD